MQGATENSLVIIDEFGKGTATVLVTINTFFLRHFERAMHLKVFLYDCALAFVCYLQLASRESFFASFMAQVINKGNVMNCKYY